MINEAVYDVKKEMTFPEEIRRYLDSLKIADRNGSCYTSYLCLVVKEIYSCYLSGDLSMDDFGYIREAYDLSSLWEAASPAGRDDLQPEGKDIVIGAGPAGITAAYELAEKGGREHNAVIIDGSSEIGGISRTVDYKGNRMDIGGHRFFSRNEDIVRWWKNICPDIMVRKRSSRIYYHGKFFDYPITVSSVLKNMSLMEICLIMSSYLMARVSFHCRRMLRFAFKKPHLVKKGFQYSSLEEFYISRFGKRLYNIFFRNYTRKLWGRDPSCISADWGRQRVKGISISEMVRDILLRAFTKSGGSSEASLTESFYYPKYGPGRMWETALSRCLDQGTSLRQECEVVALRLQNGRITQLILHDLESSKYRAFPVGGAGNVFSSMPLKDLFEGFLLGNPELESDPGFIELLDIARGLPYRDYIIVGLLLRISDIHYGADSSPTDRWIYVQDDSVEMGRIRFFNNWSPYMVSEDGLAWVGCEYFLDEDSESMEMDDGIWQQKAYDELIRIGIADKDARLLDAHVERRPKAYPAYFDSYDSIDRLTDFLDSIENLYCIGRNGQHRYNNMDHSMMTAMIAVEASLCRDPEKKEKLRKDLWMVNADSCYHERK